MTTDNHRDHDESSSICNILKRQQILKSSAKVGSLCFAILPLKLLPPYLLPLIRYVRLKQYGKSSVPRHHSGGGEMGILFGFYCCYNSEPLKMSWYYSLSLACLLRWRSAADSTAGTAASTDKLKWWGAIRERKSVNEVILFQLGMGAGKFILLWTFSVILQGCLALKVMQDNKKLMKLRMCVTAAVWGKWKMQFWTGHSI